MRAQIKPLNGEMVMVLSEDVLHALGVAAGDTVELDVDTAGTVHLSNKDASRSVRLARGRDFMDRYRETLDILAN